MHSNGGCDLWAEKIEDREWYFSSSLQRRRRGRRHTSSIWGGDRGSGELGARDKVSGTCGFMSQEASTTSVTSASGPCWNLGFEGVEKDAACKYKKGLVWQQSFFELGLEPKFVKN